MSSNMVTLTPTDIARIERAIRKGSEVIVRVEHGEIVVLSVSRKRVD